MFTGLVQKIGHFEGLLRDSSGGCVARIRLQSPWKTPLQKGESIAVQGCCLTVVSFNDTGFDADVLEETLQVTALKDRIGQNVNLERALCAGDHLGGHIVQGHVDSTVNLTQVTPAGRDVIYRFRMSDEVARYVVYKGSVALDGTSLTVSAVGDHFFEVCLIPTTREDTSLSERKVGDRVNLETDVIGRYVERFLLAPSSASKPSAVTEEFLRKAGFNI